MTTHSGLNTSDDSIHMCVASNRGSEIERLLSEGLEEIRARLEDEEAQNLPTLSNQRRKDGILAYNNTEMRIAWYSKFHNRPHDCHGGHLVHELVTESPEDFAERVHGWKMYDPVIDRKRGLEWNFEDRALELSLMLALYYTNRKGHGGYIPQVFQEPFSDAAIDEAKRLMAIRARQIEANQNRLKAAADNAGITLDSHNMLNPSVVNVLENTRHLDIEPAGSGRGFLRWGR